MKDMKVKIFGAEDTCELQEKINKWLDEKGVRVEFITQSGNEYWTTISIFYE